MGALTTADAAGLSAALLAWWELHGRGGIPWKLLPGGAAPAPGQDLDPYGIWIAEVMLQQTQLAVVLMVQQPTKNFPYEIAKVLSDAIID